MNEQPMSTALSEYVSLLLQLHALIREDRDEPEQTDVIRDAMDGPWHALTEEEKSLVRRLSADLNNIGNRDVAEKRDTAVLEHIEAALKASDWMTLLDVLQQHALHISPAARARLRGDAWFALGVPGAACLFYQDALRAIWPSEAGPITTATPNTRSPRVRSGHFPRYEI